MNIEMVTVMGKRRTPGADRVDNFPDTGGLLTSLMPLIVPWKSRVCYSRPWRPPLKSQLGLGE